MVAAGSPAPNHIRLSGLAKPYVWNLIQLELEVLVGESAAVFALIGGSWN